jgi:hypothetical protein
MLTPKWLLANLPRACKNKSHMERILKEIWLLIIICFSISTNNQAQLRIMPMGNSITYDENSYDYPPHVRPVGDRISYRYKLYQLITEAGYSFDFVGSEDAGNNYFQNAEMDDNAGFPGIDKEQLAYLMKYGKNLVTGIQITPGYYMATYPADIILLHIGTNNLNPYDVDVVFSALLDNIRYAAPNAIILVARIINRYGFSSSQTTLYNDYVQALIANRGDSKIISVNMETGAGINYYADMFDDLHPNTTGYNKMAAKWFQAIDGLNQAPVVSTIPQQSIPQGTSAFNNISLDPYVTDAEDADNAIQWTYRQQAGSKYTVSISTGRVLSVSVNDLNWYGSETITLKARDSGSGAFQKTDSVDVAFTVTKGNEPPSITSVPVTTTNEDDNYSYTITATDNDGDPLTYSAPVKPSWLSFSSSTHILSGKPTNSEVGIHNVTLRVTDGKDPVDQSFQLTVVNVNDLPVITSTPITSVDVNTAYLYEFTAADVDVGDILTYSALSKPAWLNFSSDEIKGILYGTPLAAQIGPNSVILKVSDGKADILQGFTIMVNDPTGIDENEIQYKYTIYPNPASRVVYFKSYLSANIRLMIYDASGLLQKEVTAKNTDELEIDVSDLRKGMYLYKILTDDHIITGKLSLTD